MNSFMPSAMDWIVSLLFFHKYGFDINNLTKVDYAIKETKPNLLCVNE